MNKNCLNCGRKFIISKSAQKYCSNLCKLEGIKKYKKIYYLNHQIEHQQQVKKYKKLHKLNIIQQKRKYYQSPEGIYISLKFGAKQRNIAFLISKLDFINWYNSQIKKCYYCKRDWNQIEYDIYNLQKSRLSIDRKDNNKGYIIDNIVLCCMRCNLIKSNYFTEVEMLKIGQIIKNKGN